MTDFAAIFKEATDAAISAANAEFERTGDYSTCGFAWVDITPARGPFITFLKKQIKEAAKDFEPGSRGHRIETQRAEAIYGSKGWNGGWNIWNPSNHGAQSVHIKEAGADAFAKVLRKYGINAESGSRVD